MYGLIGLFLRDIKSGDLNPHLNYAVATVFHDCHAPALNLGGVKKGGTVSNIDANDITTTSAYSINDVNYSTHNLPSQWGILVTIRASDISYVCIQLWKTASGSGFHVRLFTESGSSAFWSEWARLDNA